MPGTSSFRIRRNHALSRAGPALPFLTFVRVGLRNGPIQTRWRRESFEQCANCRRVECPRARVPVYSSIWNCNDLKTHSYPGTPVFACFGDVGGSRWTRTIDGREPTPHPLTPLPQVACSGGAAGPEDRSTWGSDIGQRLARTLLSLLEQFEALPGRFGGRACGVAGQGAVHDQRAGLRGRASLMSLVGFIVGAVLL